MYSQVFMTLEPFKVTISSAETLKNNECQDSVIIMHFSIQFFFSEKTKYTNISGGGSR